MTLQFQTKAAYMLVYQRQDLEEWLGKNSDRPFPFLKPIFSPRAMDTDGNSSRSSFNFNELNDDAFNNNTDVPMDVS